MEEVEKDTPEIVLEARRTTHAVRAVARFAILFATYQIVASLLIVLGSFLAIGSPGASVTFIVIGALVAIWGIVHSLSAGFEELKLSERPFVMTPAGTASNSSGVARLENGLLEGFCSCTAFDRGFKGTAFTADNVQYCLLCERELLPKR